MLDFRKIMRREHKSIEEFFPNLDIEIPGLPSWINDKKIQKWQQLGLDMHYLPGVALKPDLDSPLWREKPRNNFYEKIALGRISSEAARLPDSWILIDGRDKPEKKAFWITQRETWLLKKIGLRPQNYFRKNSKQAFREDFLEKILSEKGFASRFCLSVNDIKKIIPWVADILNIPSGKAIVRLPYFIEYNYLGNVFYHQWSTTATWEWFADRIDNNQYLAGGSESLGTLGWEPPSFWSTILAFRFLVELGKNEKTATG